jgi:hypothetical protein
MPSAESYLEKAVLPVRTWVNGSARNDLSARGVRNQKPLPAMSPRRRRSEGLGIARAAARSRLRTGGKLDPMVNWDDLAADTSASESYLACGWMRRR